MALIHPENLTGEIFKGTNRSQTTNFHWLLKIILLPSLWIYSNPVPIVLLIGMSIHLSQGGFENDDQSRGGTMLTVYCSSTTVSELFAPFGTQAISLLKWL